MADAVIRVENLTAGYEDEAVVEDVSFEVPTGEVFALLGGSGCGKSTLMKTMIGLQEPLAGRVWICGEELTALHGGERRRLLKRIGVAYQSGALFGSMSVLENVRLPLEEHTELDALAVDMVACMKLRAVGIEHASGQMPAEISGGMAKRAAIARAMALDPQVLFLDEPSAGLDPVTAAGVDQLIRELRRSLETTFVLVTHELPSIYEVADRALMLDGEARGAIALGTPEELRESDDERVRSFFRREASAPGAKHGNTTQGE
jgi:phospholipid/cholesterol/gamma-HCH transport system ATP-binding protein